jgi:uncharacterized protein (UPF0335 family)
MTKHQASPASSGGVAAKELAAIVDRLERLDQEIAGLNDDKKDLYSETKSRGYDTKAIKTIIAQRRQLEKNPEAYNETQSMIELYRAALGMSSQIDLFSDPSA